jgi:hypothetical protein
MLILFLQIAVILVTCQLFGYVGKRAGQARAVCDMVAGIALGPSLLGVLAPVVQSWLFPHQVTVLAGDVATTAAHPSMSVLYALSQLGLALYMFIVGLDFDTSLFRSRVRSVGVVSLAGIVVPLLLGAAAALSIDTRRASSTDRRAWQAALFLGASMSVTAFPMLARILDEKGLLSTRLGRCCLPQVRWTTWWRGACWRSCVGLNAAPAADPGHRWRSGLRARDGVAGRPAFAIFARWTERDGAATPATLVDHAGGPHGVGGIYRFHRYPPCVRCVRGWSSDASRPLRR